jgi:protocatechuate 3,4-dioxygenase beta subunit
MKKPRRREVIFLLGSTAASTLIGRAGEAAPVISGSETAAAACIVTPDQTEGPYFVEEQLNRSDIRVDPSTGAVKAGVPLSLTLRLSKVSAGVCTPLAGTLIDVWHCDALGTYSDVRDGRFSTVGQKFLRGYQVSDAAGTVTFQTIYPGWYTGRAVHIHFKVRTNPAGSRGREFTSQLYFDEAITDAVHANAPYNSKGRRNTLNAADRTYRSGGPQLTMPLIRQGGGYAATFDIGVQL